MTEGKAAFQSKQAQEAIAYVDSQYGGTLEFLWRKFPTNAIWRRTDNSKWYGVLLTVSRRKLGLDSDEVVEIIDLRADPAELPHLLACPGYYPGWHMNKQNWLTIILDGSVPLDIIQERIDISYAIAGKK